jgi:hypothetical protein
MNCWHFGFCCSIWSPSFFEEAKIRQSGGLFVAGPRIHLDERDNDGRQIDAEFNGNSTRHHSNTMHCRVQDHWQRPHNHQQHLLAILPFLHNCFIPKLPRIQHQIHSAHSGRKQRPDTHKPKHSIENTPAPNIVHFSTTPRPCSRQPLLSSQITKPSNIHRFRPVLPSSFCISHRPSRRAISSWQTQCPKYDFFHKKSAKSLKQVAPVLSRNHNSDPAGSAQNLTILSPTLLPLNPFQSFVLHGTWAGGTTHPNNSDLYPCRSMFGELKPPTNERPAAYHTRTPFSPQLRRCIVAQHPKARP